MFFHITSFLHILVADSCYLDWWETCMTKQMKSSICMKCFIIILQYISLQLFNHACFLSAQITLISKNNNIQEEMKDLIALNWNLLDPYRYCKTEMKYKRHTMKNTDKLLTTLYNTQRPAYQKGLRLQGESYLVFTVLNYELMGVFWISSNLSY